MSINEILIENKNLAISARNKMQEELSEQINLISQIKDYASIFTDDPDKISAETSRIISENGELRAENSSIKEENERLSTENSELERLRTENNNLLAENSQLNAKKEELILILKSLGYDTSGIE